MNYEWPPMRLSDNVDISGRFFFIDALWLDGRPVDNPLTEFDTYYRSPVLDSSLIEQAATLQRRFTFGLLEAVTEKKVPESQLLKVVDGQTYLHDTNLFGMMVDWYRKIRSVEDKRANYSWARRVGAALNAANSDISREMIGGIYSFKNHDALNLLPNDLYLIVASFGAIAELIIATAQMAFRRGSIFEGKWPGWHVVHEHSQ